MLRVLCLYSSNIMDCYNIACCSINQRFNHTDKSSIIISLRAIHVFILRRSIIPSENNNNS